MRPRVAYWQNIPAPYVVDRFNALARRGNVELDAWFSYRTESDRSWSVEEGTWDFAYRYLPSARAGGRVVPFPAPLLGRSPPELLISLYGWPWFVAGFALARARCVRIAFECEVTSDRWVVRRVWKERAKHVLFPRLDAVVTMGAEGEAYAERYGARRERMVRVPHSIGAVHFAHRDRAESRREAVRSQLGLQGTTFVYAGRLWWGKGLDTLLDSYRSLVRGATGETSLLIVGDGEQEAHLRERSRAEELPNVVFAGFRQQEELPELLAAADAFVFPTLGDPYGLVVEEAMAASLPVIASRAAGEIGARIEDGVTGYVVPPREPGPLAARMRALHEDEALRRRLGSAAALAVAGRTPERWAERFEEAVEQIMALPPAARRCRGVLRRPAR